MQSTSFFALFDPSIFNQFSIHGNPARGLADDNSDFDSETSIVPWVQ